MLFALSTQATVAIIKLAEIPTSSGNIMGRGTYVGLLDTARDCCVGGGGEGPGGCVDEGHYAVRNSCGAARGWHGGV